MVVCLREGKGREGRGEGRRGARCAGTRIRIEDRTISAWVYGWGWKTPLPGLLCEIFGMLAIGFGDGMQHTAYGIPCVLKHTSHQHITTQECTCTNTHYKIPAQVIATNFCH